MSQADSRAVLVVEDDQEIRETLQQVLEDEGYVVLPAANGREALEALNASRPLPRLILLDIMMPIMDGWEFRRAQQRDPQLADIPVVVLTADGRADTKARQMNAHAGLKKPIHLDALLEAVARHGS